MFTAVPRRSQPFTHDLLIRDKTLDETVEYFAEVLVHQK